MTPAQRREAVSWLREEKVTSERLACRIVRQPRATQRRCGRGRADKASEAETRLLELAQAHAAWGCPKLHRQLRHEGHRINHKRTERLYRQHGLSKIGVRVNLATMVISYVGKLLGRRCVIRMRKRIPIAIRRGCNFYEMDCGYYSYDGAYFLWGF